MKNTQLQRLIEIAPSEKSAFKQLIISKRRDLISSPSDNVKKALDRHREYVDEVRQKHNISEVIYRLREAVYSQFLVQESVFNAEVLKCIGEKLATPKNILDTVITENLVTKGNHQELIASIKAICGEYAGHISPFIYELSLSNTQSRRSRAGKTFEAIIYILYEVFGYPYESQKSIGRKQFAEQDLGKIVDSLLPSIDAFTQRRDKVVIGTMKTTLRERWQEVIEEQSRTNLPNIYLLTLDDDITDNKAKQMGAHNVIIVVPEDVKQQSQLSDKRNIISFEQYFLTEIPEKLAYWRN